MTKIQEKTLRLVQLGLLCGLIILLQMYVVIPLPGGLTLSLVLVPIVVGAVLFGPADGALLGGVFGAVVSVIKTDLGRKEEARCVLFPDHFQWENVHTVPVAKADNAAGIREFDSALQPILKEIRLLERQQGAK